MNLLVKMTFIFSSGSFLGWILELFYRKWFGAHNPNHKWINPGFLTGPCLPLYGFGLCGLYLMARIPLPEMENKILQKILLFIAMSLVMTLLEFIAGIIFIKGMHVKLWDYDNEKFNILGIICPKFSFYWAILCGGYYFLIDPKIASSLSWLEDNMAFCLVIGFFYGILSVDIVYTFNIVSKMRRFAIEHDVIVRYEAVKADIRARADESKEKARFLLAFLTSHPLSEILDKQVNKIKSLEEKLEDTIENIEKKLKK